MWFRRTVHALHCTDSTRRPRLVEIRPATAPAPGPRVEIVIDGHPPMLLDPCQVGWLRRELQAAIVRSAELTATPTAST